MANFIIDPFSDDTVEIVKDSDSFDESQQNFRYHATSRRENFTIAHVSAEETEKGVPLICVEKEISRPFRNPGEKFGTFGTVYRIDSFTPDKFIASMAEILNGKADITSLSFDKQIPSYAPETDVHHVNQKVFFQEKAAQLLGEHGVSVDTGFAEDFRALESVPVIKGQLDAIETAHQLKQEYRELKRRLEVLEKRIESEINQGLRGLERINFSNLPEEEKVKHVPFHYQAEWADLAGKLYQLWDIIFKAKREVVGENFKRMAIPESVTVDEDEVVERNMDLTLNDGAKDGEIEDIEVEYVY